jgi:nucleoside-diphosphate-sugar epimerase
VLPADGEGVCNAVFVDDVVDALILAAMNPGRSGEKYIISGPEPTTWNEFFESHNQFLGKESIQYLDGTMFGARRSGLAGKINDGLANPMRLANWKPVRLILNMIQKLLGDRVIKRLRNSIRRLIKPRQNIIYYPDAGELELYYAQGECRIEKAREMLGYAPRFDFKSGFALTTEYIGSKLGTNSG